MVRKSTAPRSSLIACSLDPARAVAVLGTQTSRVLSITTKLQLHQVPVSSIRKTTLTLTIFHSKFYIHVQHTHTKRYSARRLQRRRPSEAVHQSARTHHRARKERPYRQATALDRLRDQTRPL